MAARKARQRRVGGGITEDSARSGPPDRMEQIGLADKLTHNRLSKSNVSNALLPCGSFGPLVGVTGCAHAGYLGVQALSGMNLPTEALRKTLQCRYSHSLSFARSARSRSRKPNPPPPQGVGVRDLGFRVWGLGFRGLGFKSRV